MNDEGIGQGYGSDHGAPGGTAGPVQPTAPDGPSADALESLERLQALGGGPQRQSAPQRPRQAATARRPKMPAVSRQGLSWARFAAPIVFLAAVLIVVSLAVQSGVVGGDDQVDPKPAAATTGKAKPSASSSAAATYKVYVVKTGDSLSGIADKFDTTVTDLEDLNLKADLTTLQVGQKIKVPR